MNENFTILDGVDATSIVADLVEDDRQVRLSKEVVRDTLGWRLEDEGLCHGDVCIPVRDRDALLRDGAFELESLAETLRRPLVLDFDERVAALGTPAADRSEAMIGLEAPDFTLPDLEGHLHSLSDHRGKKVLLIAYASW